MTVTSSHPLTTTPAGSGFGGFLTQILSDRDQYFTEVVAGEGLSAKLWYSTCTLVVLCALYGAAAGAYASAAQALSAAIKLPLLFLGTLAICFPGFFVVQVLVGSRLRLAQVLALVMGALALSAVLLAAVVPVTVFFLFAGANYYFLTLLHVVVVLAAGLVGMAALHEGLAFACEQRGVFRHSEGNFYTALVYSLQKLAQGEGRRIVVTPPSPRLDVRGMLDSQGLPAVDSLGTNRP